MFFDFGEIAVNVVNEIRSMSRLGNSHAFEHLENQTANDWPSGLFIDESIECRSDDVREEPTSESHPIDRHNRCAVSSRTNGGSDAG